MVALRTPSGFGLAFGLLSAVVCLSGAPGCDGWEGDVIVSPGPGANPSPLLICPPETLQIRVLLSDGRLATFSPDPLTPTLTDVVQLTCGATTATGQSPSSFAVDRHGDVWLVDSDGTLFTARRGSGNCLPTGFGTAVAGGPIRMAFVSDSSAPDKELLYVVVGVDKTSAGVPRNSELGVLSLTGKPVLGKRVKIAGWPMLTGTFDQRTGKGQLWGLFPATAEDDAYAAEIDTTTGAEGPRFYSAQAIVSPQLPSFVYWGGDFWLFDGSSNYETRVSRVDWSPRVAVAEWADMTPRVPPSGVRRPTVVSAAVSTCATSR